MSDLYSYIVLGVVFIAGFIIAAFVLAVSGFAGNVRRYLDSLRAHPLPQIKEGERRRFYALIDRMSTLERLHVIRHLMRGNYDARVSISDSGLQIQQVGLTEYLDDDNITTETG